MLDISAFLIKFFLLEILNAAFMKDKNRVSLNSFSHNSGLARMGHGRKTYQRAILPKKAKLSLSSCQEYNGALHN